MTSHSKSQTVTGAVISNQDETYAICQEQCAKLREKIDDYMEDINNYLLQDMMEENQNDYENLTSLNKKVSFQICRTLKGHNGKIYDCDWSRHSQLLLSGSQDGHLILWDAIKSQKRCTYPLKSSWVTSCSFSPSTRKIASGGLDNLCSIYDVDDDIVNLDNANDNNNNNSSVNKNSKRNSLKRNSLNDNHRVYNGDPSSVLQYHEGYVTSVKFLNDEKIITASGDSTAILWDIQKKLPEKVFLDHAGDVMDVAINKSINSNLFLTGSVDATAKLWDIREEKCVGNFQGHDSDINSIDWFPDNYAFATGSDDSTCLLFDIRSYRMLNEYSDEQVLSGVTSVSFSHESGRLLFCGYDDEPFGLGWDIVYGNKLCKLMHSQRVNSLSVAPNSTALCTSSWDKLLRIWIPKF